jgi:hypothetical protein
MRCSTCGFQPLPPTPPPWLTMTNALLAYNQGTLTEGYLLVLITIDQLLFIMKTLVTFYKTSYHNEEINRNEPSPSISVPCLPYFSAKSSYKKFTVQYLEKVFLSHVSIGEACTIMPVTAIQNSTCLSHLG